MNILILGSGGREHALAYKIAQSKQCKKLFVAPGNAGTANLATNLTVNPNDFDQVKDLVITHQIEMLIVGPEDPLVNGIQDFFASDKALQHVHLIGPSKEGARLEGSKERAKEFMQNHQIPTAAYQSFNASQVNEAKKFLTQLKPPYVLKADGLAAGKGVLIIEDLKEAENALDEMLTQQKFGEASSKVVIEEFLDGIELSVFVLTDGKNYKILPNAKDYKRIGEGDTGLNTGGMGAISPVPFADENFMKHVEEDIVQPTIHGLQKENINYKGFVFIGLMKVGDKAKVIEYNVRMGDPETEVVLPRIESDLLEALSALKEQKLNQINLQISPSSATTLMLVSGGYPEAYEKGKNITGLDQVGNDAIVFHAGTKANGSQILTNGGRVLAITAVGNDFKDALKISYKYGKIIDFEGKYYRTDLGKDLEEFIN